MNNIITTDETNKRKKILKPIAIFLISVLVICIVFSPVAVFLSLLQGNDDTDMCKYKQQSLKVYKDRPYDALLVHDAMCSLVHPILEHEFQKRGYNLIEQKDATLFEKNNTDGPISYVDTSYFSIYITKLNPDLSSCEFKICCKEIQQSNVDNYQSSWALTEKSKDYTDYLIDGTAICNDGTWSLQTISF